MVWSWKEAGHEYHNISHVAPPTSPQPSSPHSHTPQSLSPQAHVPHPHGSQSLNPQPLTPQPHTPQPLTPQQLTPQPRSPMSRTPQPHTPIPEAEGGFSSGPMEAQGSFAHTFDAAGSFSVASQGARNVMGHVRVWDNGMLIVSSLPLIFSKTCF